MKAIQVEEYGGSDKLQLVDVPEPAFGEGEVLVRIAYAGVNFIDVYMRDGVFRRLETYPNRPPFTLGMEGAGIIEAVGPGVTEFAKGDTVGYCLEVGSYAEFAVVPAWKLVKIPADIPLDVATTLQLQGMTAHYLTHSLFPLTKEHTCLIHAGAGGMGQLAIQLAKIRGARVIVTVGSQKKAEIAMARGADYSILYRDVDFAEAVLDITDGVGADVVYDSVGKETLKGSLKCLKSRGMLSNNGNASGAIGALDPLDLAEAGSVFFTRPHLASYIPTAKARAERSYELYRLYKDGNLDVTIDRTLPLSQVEVAHNIIEERKSMGKLLLLIGDI
jgi:NADPH2:quinone reductase